MKKTNLARAITLRNQPSVSGENIGRISCFEFCSTQRSDLSVCFTQRRNLKPIFTNPKEAGKHN